MYDGLEDKHPAREGAFIHQVEGESILQKEKVQRNYSNGNSSVLPTPLGGGQPQPPLSLLFKLFLPPLKFSLEFCEIASLSERSHQSYQAEVSTPRQKLVHPGIQNYSCYIQGG